MGTGCRGVHLRDFRTLCACLIVIFITTAQVHPLHAQSNETTDRASADQVWGSPATWNNPPSAAKFDNPMPIGMGARAIGMGEAFTALADEESAVWYNPAGLTQMNKNEVDWMGGDRYSQSPYLGFLSASYMLQNRMVFALSWERPWHPTGFYPDMVSGVYPGFTKWGNSSQPITIPGTEGVSTLPFTSMTDTAMQAFLAQAYRAYINPPFQEDNLVFTYATPLSPDQNLSFGINIEYIYNDGLYQSDTSLTNQTLQTIADVAGWGIDLGFQYRQPLSRFGKEVSFGLDIRDVAGQVRFNSGTSSGEEITLSPVSTLGLAWKTTDFLTHSDLNLTTDFIYINDPALNDNEDRRLYLGGEMWFFNERIGPRAGYRMFFNRELSGPTIGISFRYLIGLDYAYMFPQENEGATNWFTLSYRWGGIVEVPVLPDVAVSVDPPIFAPRNGEFATFALSADAPNGVDRWNLNIIDRNNMVVKSYQDRGEPPAQIIWGGEDKTYRTLPDGEYTFLLTATDHKGNSSSTPVQTLKLYTPPKPVPEVDNIDKLRQLIKDQNAAEEGAEDGVKKANLAKLQETIKKQAANTTIPDVAKAPEEPKALTPLAEARAAAGSFSYPRVNDVPFATSKVVIGEDGKKAYVIEFQPQHDNPRGILIDMADVIRTATSDIGQSVERYDVTAHYGDRSLRVVAPASSAYSLSKGFTTREQFLENSAVTLDGNPISPSYR
jgi:hypothetical protein